MHYRISALAICLTALAKQMQHLVALIVSPTRSGLSKRVMCFRIIHSFSHCSPPLLRSGRRKWEMRNISASSTPSAVHFSSSASAPLTHHTSIPTEQTADGRTKCLCLSVCLSVCLSPQSVSPSFCRCIFWTVPSKVQEGC